MTLDLTGGVIQTTKAVLHDGDVENFLLVREPDETWGLPGGAKDVEDADLLETLQRELREELSLELGEYEVTDAKTTTEFLYEQQGSERFGHKGFNNFFIVKVSDVGVIRKEEQLLEVRWFTAAQAEEQLEHEAMRIGFSRVVKMLKEQQLQ